jgi:orotate phosphoribosyltransferase
MKEEILNLFAARRGHFRFESGHHGNLWLDIPRAYVNPKRLRRYAVELARSLSAHHIDAVCGPLVEGALLAQMIAEEIGAEFCFAEQFAQTPPNGLYLVGYRIPRALRTSIRGKRIAIVDDVINAGSAVRGTAQDLHACGACIAAIGALLTLGAPASSLATSLEVPLETLSQIPKNDLWEPSSCPLCASGAALDESASSRE